MFEGLVSAMKLDGNGRTVADPDTGMDIIWSWGDWYEMDDEAKKLVRKTGWMDADGNFLGKENGEGVLIPDVTLAMGEAVWVQSDSTTWQIQCAGEVYNATVPITLLEGGSKFCANPCPANIGLSQTIISNYTVPEEEWAMFEGLVSAMKLDGNGKTVADPNTGMDVIWSWGDWYEMDDEAKKLVRKTGWMDADGNFLGKENGEGVLVPDVPLAIGEGVWVQSDSTTWQFVFPNVFDL